MPPDISFGEIPETILVLNNSPVFTVDSSSNELMQSISEDQEFIIDTIMIHNFFDGLFSVLDESHVDYLRNMKYIEIRSPNTGVIPDALSLASVIDFCEDYSADAVIVLEYIDLNIKYNHGFLNNYLSGYMVEAFIALERKLIWRIYDYTGAILDQHILNDTIFWSNQGYFKEDAYGGLPKPTDVIRAGFYSAGQDFGRRISPHWQTVSRIYYRIRNIDQVDQSLNEDFLLELSEHNNKKKSYKACFNLAYLSELEDNLRSALRWLEIAEIKNPSSPYADMYRKVIEERIATRDMIK